LQLVSAPLERGIIVGGEVREPEALAAELKKMFSKHKLPRKGIRLGIASNRVGLRTLEIAPIDDDKLFENAIRFHAQELLPIPLGDAILDHVVLGETEGPDGPLQRVLIAFAHRDLVDRYVSAFKSARLKVAAVDVEAFALLRALGPGENGNGATPDRATVVVAVGQERTIFAVAEGSTCDFTRVLEWGGGALTVAMARSLDMTPSQAEPIKRLVSLDGDAGESGLSPEGLASARGAIRTEIQVLARELLASLQFYQSKPGSLPIGELLLTGGGSELGGLPATLQESLGVPVRVVDPFQHVKAGKKTKVPADRGAAAIAIGLGMEA
jgi:type IV pilus assembly protein PilM